MKNRPLALALSALAGLGLAQLIGCGSPSNESSDESSTDQTLAALAACHLNDGTVEPDALLRACDPHDTKKTTICHIPPGNPANAHTLCIGNPAVPHHLKNHGDHVGPCANETPCTPPPPPPGGAGGSCSCGDHPAGTGGAAVGTGGAAVIVGTGGTGGVTIVIP